MASTRDAASQTAAAATQHAAAQAAPLRASAGAGTRDSEEEEGDDPSAPPPPPAPLPAAVAPLLARMAAALDTSRRSSALQGYVGGPGAGAAAALGSGAGAGADGADGGAAPRVVASLAQAFAQPDDGAAAAAARAAGRAPPLPPPPLRLPCAGLSWSAGGAMLAAAFGLGAHAHGGWCRHRAGVAVWSAAAARRPRAAGSGAGAGAGAAEGKRDGPSSSSSLPLPGLAGARGDAGAAPALALEVVLECESCVSAVAFHPTRPSLLAAGTFGGEIVVWDLARGAAGGGVSAGGVSAGGVSAGGTGAGAGGPSPGDGDLVMCRTRVDDFLHREAVVGLAWAADAALGREPLLLSLGREGRLLVWAPANALAHPVGSFQVAVAAPRGGAGAGAGGGGGGGGARRGGGGGGADDYGSDVEGGPPASRAAAHGAAAPLAAVGGASLSAPPEGASLLCYVGGEGGAVLRCEAAVSAAALATAAQAPGSPWRPEHRAGAVQRAENALPWEQAAAEALLRCAEPQRAKACRAAERAAREAGARCVTLGLLYASRPEAAPGVAVAAAAAAGSGALGAGAGAGAPPAPPPEHFLFPSPVRAQLAPHAGAAACVAASPARRHLLASCGADGRLCVLSALRARPLLEIEPAAAAAAALAVAAGGSGGSGSGPGGASASASASAGAGTGIVGLLSCAWSRANPLLLAAGAADGAVSLFDLFASTSAPALVLRGGAAAGPLAGAPAGAAGALGAAGAAGAGPAAGATALAFHPSAHAAEPRAARRLLLAVGDAAGAVRLWRLPLALCGEGLPTRAALEALLGDAQ